MGEEAYWVSPFLFSLLLCFGKMPILGPVWSPTAKGKSSWLDLARPFLSAKVECRQNTPLFKTQGICARLAAWLPMRAMVYAAAKSGFK
jgi:hypothetical protein